MLVRSFVIALAFAAQASASSTLDDVLIDANGNTSYAYFRTGEDAARIISHAS